MTITPDQAEQMLGGATSGPWHVCDDPDDPGGTFIYDDLGNMRIAVANPVSAYSGDDLDLIAAAPDLARTVIDQAEKLDHIRSLARTLVDRHQREGHEENAHEEALLSVIFDEKGEPA